jgi:hypothetical protein
LDPRERRKVKLLVKKNLTITNCVKLQEYNENSYGSSDLPVVRFELKTSLVFYLATHRRYNRQFFNVTAFDALQKLEENIKSELKDGIHFNFKYVPKPVINKHIYESVLITGKCDLFSPLHILENYKLAQVPTYYFYDDFYYDDKMKSEGTCVFTIAKVNQDQFTKLDITDKKYVDFVQSFDPTPLIHQLVDKTRFFDNPTSQYNFLLRTKNQLVQFSQELQSKVATSKTVGTFKNDPKDYDRFDSTQFENIATQIKKGANNLLRLYAPDTKENALERFEKTSNLFREQYQAIYTFKNCKTFFDVLQFNRIFNLDITDLKNFNYLPIGIINRFHKLNSPENIYTHTCSFQMLKFKPKS